jgi:type 1 fimbria pilin
MTRASILIGLIASIGVFTTFTTPAFAEFESRNESSDKGTGELLQVKIALGSNNIRCAGEEEEEAGASVGWSIKAEGKEVKKASGIGLKVEKWGQCIDTIGSEQEKTKISECEMEMTQPGKEVQVKGKIVKTCTIDIDESCELKIGTQQVKLFELNTAGGSLEGEKEKAGESTGVSLEISGMTVEAPKACSSLGIKGNSAATLEGVVVLQQAQNPAPALTFRKTGGGVFNAGGGSNQGAIAPYFEFRSTGGPSAWLCTKGKFTGTIAATGPSIETTPEYEECEETRANSMLVAAVDVTGCTYEYRMDGRDGAVYTGTELLKGTTCEIKLALVECSFIIKNQPAPVFLIHFENLPGGKMVVLYLRTGPLKYKTGANVTRCNGTFGVNEDRANGFSFGSYILNEVGTPPA